MKRRLTDLVRALSAIVAIAVLVVGTPLALAIAVGWPLPTSIPNADAMREALGAGGIHGDTIAKLVAVVIWLAWMQVLAAFVLEIAALIRRRPPLALPGMGAVQVSIARLVAGVALLGSALGPVRASADPAPMPKMTLVASVTPSADAPTPRPPTERAKDAPTYEVRRHDSLWSIAEAHLGDGFRWREIRDLNAGRTMADGSTFDASSDLVQPGWVLDLPDDATPVVLPTDPVVVVEPGDSLWSIAEDTAPAVLGREPTAPELDAHWRAVVDANRDRLADPADPSLIFAGQEIVVPDLAPAAPEADVPPVIAIDPRPDAIDHPDEVVTEPAAALTEDEVRPSSEESAPSTGRLGVAAAGMAVGISAELVRRRRRRLMANGTGSVPAPPPAELRVITIATTLDADDDLVERRAGALRAIAQVLSTTDVAVRPRLVQVSSDRVEVLLSRPLAPAPAPWKAEGGGQVWCTEEDLRVTPGCDPSPSLVTIGADERDVQLCFDLEAAGVVSLSGDEGVAGVLRSFARELAASTFVQRPEILVLDGLTELAIEGITGVTWTEVAEDLLARAEQTRDYLRANRWSSAHDARAAHGIDDATSPVVAIFASPPDDERFVELCEVVAGGLTAMSVVVVGQAPLATTIVVERGLTTIPSFDLVCRSQHLEVEAARDVDALLAHATDGQVVLLAEATPELPATIDLRDAITERPAVSVRVLGEIDVVGGRRPLTPKQVAVLAYIALHAPVAAERVEDAVWPNGTMASRKRLANTVSDCRNAIGAIHLPIATDGRYTVGPGVGTDLQEFDRLVGLGSHVEGIQRMELLRSALALVRGPVFSYRSTDRDSFVWIDLENWLSTWELKVINVALEASELALDLDDVDTSVWAAEQGLRVSALHSTLVESLMRALWRRGDGEAAERVYQSHVAALEEIDGDTVAETTIDLRDEIRSSRSA